MISFVEQCEEWSSPPVDYIGYIPSESLLQLPDADFKDLMLQAEKHRYSGWRNWQGRWRDVLGLDRTHGQIVLDYGSGVGIEAAQYARTGNIVALADISPANLRVAQRTVFLLADSFTTTHALDEHPPFTDGIADGFIDVIHCSGVLHHIPNPEPVVAQFHKWLAADGELRLMLYSDRAWEISTGTDPPESVEGHPKAFQFTRAWDGVGKYADWYNAERLVSRFGRWFALERYEDLTVNGAYVGAVLSKR